MSIFKDARLSPLFDTPLYQKVYANLRTSILSGELKGGVKLPSTRALAEELNVSRNTILNAYRQLMAEGYIESVQGSGTYVARIAPDDLFTPQIKNASTDEVASEPLKRHFVHIFTKLGVDDRTEAVTVALKRKIIRLT